MYKKYAYIDCFSSLSEVPFNNPFCQWMKAKTIKKKILKKFPHIIEDIQFLGTDGYAIKIPVITSINFYDDEEYIKKVIKRFNGIILKYNISVLILSGPLQEYQEEFTTLVSNGKELGILFVDRVLGKVKRHMTKKEKDLKYMIVDGNNTKTEFILDLICDGINSLTLATENPSRYEERLQSIYNETGLVVQMRNKALNQEFEEDIYINCNYQQDKLFYCFKKDAIVLDFVSKEEKLANIYRNRSDLRVVSDILLDNSKHDITSDLIFGIMLNTHRLLRSMFIYGYRDSMKEKINQIKDQYLLSIKLKEVHNGSVNFLDNKNTLSYNSLNMKQD